MAVNPSKSRFSGRRKKPEATTDNGIHAVPGEVVEIERNLIETWLISLKHWFQQNIETARKIILTVAVLTVLFFIGLFIHSAMIEKQNSGFYSLMIDFENLQKNRPEKAGEARTTYETKMKALRESADKLCNARWSTQFSNASCLLSALAANSLGDYAAAAALLKNFSEDTSNAGFSSYAALVSGFFFEKSNQPAESLKLYQSLASQIDEKSGKDIALFHSGRILYHDKKYAEAEKNFQEIIDNYKTSIYFRKAREYLLLISVSKS